MNIVMKKAVLLLCLSIVCSMSYADSLDRFISKYKDKRGAEYRVVNVNSDLDAMVADGIAKGHKRAAMIRGGLVMMGNREVVTLRLDSCKQSVRTRFFADVLDVIPENYSLLMEKGNSLVYMDNSDEEYAYLLIINNSVEKPRLKQLYVTNVFVRAIMNDEGTAIDKDKFGRFLERQAEVLGEAARETGRSIGEGAKNLERHLQERIQQWEEDSDGASDSYTF